MIDYDVILADIVDLAERYRVTVVLDRWNSTATISRLQDLGIECVTFGQGFASMSGAMKETERLILVAPVVPRRQSGAPMEYGGMSTSRRTLQVTSSPIVRGVAKRSTAWSR